jgi:hypothetical protein
MVPPLQQAGPLATSSGAVSNRPACMPDMPAYKYSYKLKPTNNSKSFFLLPEDTENSYLLERGMLVSCSEEGKVCGLTGDLRDAGTWRGDQLRFGSKPTFPGTSDA